MDPAVEYLKLRPCGMRLPRLSSFHPQTMERNVARHRSPHICG